MNSSDTNIMIEPAGSELPASVTARLNGQLKGETIVAWAEFDLDADNKYAQQYAILTESQLVLIESGGNRRIPISTIDEAKIIEGLGVDRLTVIVAAALAADLRYTRR